MKKAVLCGYYGFDNAGDELILENIIEEFKKNNINIIVLSNNPKQSECFYNVKSYNRWNPFHILYSILNSDSVVMSAGLFQDITGNLSLYYYLFLIIVSKLLKRRVILLGIEFGPIIHDYNQFIIKHTIKYADYIYVRTHGSYEYLKEINILEIIPKDKIKISADVVLNTEIIQEHKEFRGNIHLIIRRPNKNNLEKNYREIVSLCEFFAEKINIKINFIPFHLEEDINYILDIVEKIKVPVTIIRWNKPKDLFKIINNADLIITQRLHGLIIATILGIPAIVISNDPKLKYFMKEISQDNYILETIDNNLIFELINKAFKNKVLYLETNNRFLYELKSRAKINSLFE